MSNVNAVEKLPLYGSLKINDFYIFLHKSKAEFYESLENAYIQPFNKLDEFDIVRFLGNGTFSNVYLVASRNFRKVYAMKVIQKSRIAVMKQVSHMRNEKNISLRLNFPFLIYFESAFHDNSNLYFVMPFITGGELFNYLVKSGKLEEECSRFVAAQVVLGLEYLHFLNVLYRDLKPENVLVDHFGYIKLSDFSFAKVLKDRTYTFCGTPEYIAPEVIMCNGYGFSVDWWALGIFLFELNAGYPPFRSKNQINIYEKASMLHYKFPKHFSSDLEHLVRNLLMTNLSLRYGNLKNGVNDIKQHAWFKAIPWMALLNRQLTAPIVPNVTASSEDLQSGDITITVSDSDEYAEYFVDF